MGMIQRLSVEGNKPLRGGADFFWATIIAKTTPEQPLFSYSDVDGACSPGHERNLKEFLRRLVTAGYVSVANERDWLKGRSYRVEKRQRDTPTLAGKGGQGKQGLAQQQMWNVMRRQPTGFTVASLAIDASTDEVVVSPSGAKEYCRRLANAGLLAILQAGKNGTGANVFVLRGSANTGPRAPKRYRADLIYDPNSEKIVGDLLVEERNQ
ncbi:hypothetical protein [Pararhizobium sp.]|uniref:hypothetical protein n=1 Tax=Pararhizobium sp. TaxID=1977563 RepID=UPI003D0D5A2E